MIFKAPSGLAGSPVNVEDFEEYTSDDMLFYLHRELWETRDLSKGELVIRIDGYGRHTLRLGPRRELPAPSNKGEETTVFDTKTKELIAIGASVVGKCQPCLEHHLAEARKAGAMESEIKAAIKIARSVRKAGNDYMDEFTDRKTGVTADKPPAKCCCDGDCG